jgi:predicted NAD-dependent protein-ADP-ribosyltransferase YbiA (DUF1768 family)
VAFKKKKKKAQEKSINFFGVSKNVNKISNFYWHFLNAHKNQFPTWGNLIPS